MLRVQQYPSNLRTQGAYLDPLKPRTACPQKVRALDWIHRLLSGTQGIVHGPGIALKVPPAESALDEAGSFIQISTGHTMPIPN